MRSELQFLKLKAKPQKSRGNKKKSKHLHTTLHEHQISYPSFGQTVLIGFIAINPSALFLSLN